MSTPPRLHGQSLWVGGSLEALPLAVEAFLHSKAWAQFAGLVGQKSHALGFGPRRIVIKDLRSRWASCTKDRTLTFSWRLIMAPLWVQEHVAAHEVAHLRYMNHGPQFHALERELSRSGDAARAWLRRYGAGLLRVG
jgi:predicted metal-dependent hydrolase